MTDKEIIKALGGNTKLYQKLNNQLNRERGTKKVIYIKLHVIDSWVRQRIPKAHKRLIAWIARRENPEVILPDSFLKLDKL